MYTYKHEWTQRVNRRGVIRKARMHCYEDGVRMWVVPHEEVSFQANFCPMTGRVAANPSPHKLKVKRKGGYCCTVEHSTGRLITCKERANGELWVKLPWRKCPSFRVNFCPLTGTPARRPISAKKK